jgi:hypothetical protein
MVIDVTENFEINWSGKIGHKFVFIITDFHASMCSSCDV